MNSLDKEDNDLEVDDLEEDDSEEVKLSDKNVWYSCDENDNIVAKTEIKSNGEIERFDSVDSDFEKGHGHEIYSSVDKFIDGGPGDIFSRPVNDEDSIGRDWEDRDGVLSDNDDNESDDDNNDEK